MNNRIKFGKVFGVFVFLTFLAAGVFSQRDPLRFSDEFRGERGTTVDASKWTAEIGGDGWGNEELQYYTSDPQNVRLDGEGNLEIRALPVLPSPALRCWYGSCRYTSSRLITKKKFEFRYGRAEARIKVPNGAGVWPAFWLLGSDIDQVGWPSCGEIDIMEFLGREPSNVYGTVHAPGYSGSNGIGKSFSQGGRSLPDEFHVFAVEWSENEIRWFLDGKQYNSFSRSDVPNGSKWVFDRTFFLIINFAVGGRWPGSPTAETKFPQSMLIDYVRVKPLT